MSLRSATGALCFAVAVAGAAPGVVAAAAEPACTTAPDRTPVIREVPWAQELYAVPEKMWPFSTGAGVTVAVIDAGVDGRHPQLRGRVLAGYDYVRATAEGNVDCLPHGTGVASIIAARRVQGIGFFGLAPAVTILPLRVTEKVELTPQSEPLDPRRLATAINAAVRQGADVIHVSTVVYRADLRLAKAVQRALARGVVVVAAVGNGHSPQRDQSGPTTGTLTPYPAAYDGVIGVGAVGPDHQRVGSSQVGHYVDLVAPGTHVTAAGVQGQNVYSGTSFASAYVSAAAALLLSAQPSLFDGVEGRARADAVRTRLLGTASPMGGPDSLAYGQGMVDPYRALTEPMTKAAPADVPGQVPPTRNPLAERRAAVRRSANDDSMRLGAAAAGLVLVVFAGAVFLPLGRRRRWRAGRAPEPPAAADDGPEFLPGHVLFQPRHELERTYTSGHGPR